MSAHLLLMVNYRYFELKFSKRMLTYRLSFKGLDNVSVACDLTLILAEGYGCRWGAAGIHDHDSRGTRLCWLPRSFRQNLGLVTGHQCVTKARRRGSNRRHSSKKFRSTFNLIFTIILILAATSNIFHSVYCYLLQ